MYTMKSVSLIHFEGIKHLNPRKLYMEKNDDGNMAYQNDYEVLSLQFLGERTTADGFKQTLVYSFFYTRPAKENKFLTSSKVFITRRMGHLYIMFSSQSLHHAHPKNGFCQID